MDNEQTVELLCESCGKTFEIFSRNYEKVVQDDMPTLCTSCLDHALEESQGEPQRSQFEYMIASTGAWSSSDTEHEIKVFNIYGQDGWELIQVVNNKAYFKREYVKGF